MVVVERVLPFGRTDWAPVAISVISTDSLDFFSDVCACGWMKKVIRLNASRCSIGRPALGGQLTVEEVQHLAELNL